MDIAFGHLDRLVTKQRTGTLNPEGLSDGRGGGVAKLVRRPSFNIGFLAGDAYGPVVRVLVELLAGLAFGIGLPLGSNAIAMPRRCLAVGRSLVPKPLR